MPTRKNKLHEDFVCKGPVYTWRTLTGVKLSTLVQKNFSSVTKTLSGNYTKRKVFKLCILIVINYDLFILLSVRTYKIE